MSSPAGPSRTEVFFFETHKLNAVRCEPLDVLEGFGDALTREAVEGPDENKIDPALRRVAEHALELARVRTPSALVIDILACGPPALGTSESAQLGQLVLDFLAPVGLLTRA